MDQPPNYTGDPNGYNRRMFRSDRAVRRGFMMLGYAVNTCMHQVPKSTVRQFQRDYNKCSRRFGQWGQVELNGALDKPTLNALEVAIRWSKKRETREGIPSARSWQSLCQDRSHKSCGECGPDGKIRAPRVVAPKPQPDERNYIEITNQGMAKVREIGTDTALRAEVMGFEREGDTVFAIVKIPPQADLPSGRDEPFRCPCVISR